MNKEKSLCRLFVALFPASLNLTDSKPVYPLSTLWQCLAFILNSKPLPLSSPIVLSLILDESRLLYKYYGRQFEKLIEVMEAEYLPLLQKQINHSEEVRRLGNAMHVSLLRHAIDSVLLMIAGRN